MSIEIGTIYEGTVTRIAAFGVFVAFGGGESGMVHISELAPVYIRDITQAVQVGDTMRVKVMSVDDRGRIALSRKQAMTEEEIAAAKAADEAARIQARAARAQRQAPAVLDFSHAPGEYTPYVRSQRESSGDAFEDMMSRFKTASDEKISDLRRYTDGRRGTKKRK